MSNINMKALNYCRYWLKWRFYFLKKSLPAKIKKAKSMLQFLQIYPVYFSVWSRDCDCYETTDAYKFPTFYHAHKSFQLWASNAEGPMSCERISRREYLKFECSSRDRVLEAFENGSSYRV